VPGEREVPEALGHLNPVASNARRVAGLEAPGEVLREIVEFYAKTSEETRLHSGPSQLEFERTQELIRRFLPTAARVADVGGASGAYAFWLAAQGSEVHLIDATPRLVEVARRANDAASHQLASIAVGDARRLPFDDGWVDAVLLLGPLYHLTQQDDRLAALNQARRILRPGGLVFAAGISRYAGTLDGLALHPTLDEQVVMFRHRAIEDGQYRNDSGDPRFFVTAYFHRPEDLVGELENAGFGDVRIFGIEGPGWLLPDFEARWADVTGRADILRVARLLEEERPIVAASAHMLAVGRKL
jgi:SAM-dependent methyltransferase